MPAVESHLAQFQAANTQVLGVSIDSIYSHANWAKSLKGISFPLLADFHPKGAVARACGVYLEGNGITDRATVIIDAGGVARYGVSVTPGGERQMNELIEACEKVNSEYSGTSAEFQKPEGVPPRSTLFVKSNCGFSHSALLAHANLHLQESVQVKNISEDPNAKKELSELTGKEQAPCLVVGKSPMFESKDIVNYFVEKASPLGPVQK